LSKKWRLLILVPILAVSFVAVRSIEAPRTALLYDPPQNLESVTKKVLGATYQISCKGDWVGSGWGIDILDQEYSYVITAFHVIEERYESQFIRGRNSVTSRFDLEVISFDGRYWGDDGVSERTSKDIAILRTKRKIESLNIQREAPVLGQWALVAGYPGEGKYFDAIQSLSVGVVSALDHLSRWTRVIITPAQTAIHQTPPIQKPNTVQCLTTRLIGLTASINIKLNIW
jgi:S1-C subfamily serine protease